MTKRHSSIKEDFVVNSSILAQLNLTKDTYDRARDVIRDLCDSGRLQYPLQGPAEKGGYFTPWTAGDGTVYECYLNMLGLDV